MALVLTALALPALGPGIATVSSPAAPSRRRRPGWRRLVAAAAAAGVPVCSLAAAGVVPAGLPAVTAVARNAGGAPARASLAPPSPRRPREPRCFARGTRKARPTPSTAPIRRLPRPQRPRPSPGASVAARHPSETMAAAGLQSIFQGSGMFKRSVRRIAASWCRTKRRRFG